jgi:hypothetical protein
VNGLQQTLTLARRSLADVVKQALCIALLLAVGNRFGMILLVLVFAPLSVYALSRRLARV